ncbi:MAG: ABC transporter ATP-binding protein [Candidatus Pacebacteria bacterium]|nr:ABC transporter ATP-binding protein [Candidatus Paceibacterota bacterium]
MKPIISAKNISKKYNITHEQGGYIAMRDVLTNIAKKPFAFLKKKVGKITGRTTNEVFWALKDINFEVQKGEAIGIIGANGAGKSTLLKILTGITPPTTGEIKMHGKVASLLEVGTGFHSELTGRENIFLNGAILGMTKKEIADKFDAIVEFSGVRKFIDTPVKRYSSGMLVRLGFSVAAHMEPDILLVDEVLAVGDAEFQKKCLGKMDEVTTKGGRTILFVSHNLIAVQKLCKRCILLEEGKIKMIGETKEIISKYLEKNTNTKEINNLGADKDKEIAFTKVWVTNDNEEIIDNINVNEKFKIWLKFDVNKDINTAEISIFLKNLAGVNITFTNLSDSFNKKFLTLKKGHYTTSTLINENFLIPDDYLVGISAHIRGVRNIDLHDNIMRFTIIENGSTMAPYRSMANQLSCVFSNAKWEICPTK